MRVAQNKASDEEPKTYKNLTKTKRHWVYNAIIAVGSADDVEEVADELYEFLQGYYKNDSIRDRALDAHDLATFKDALDTVESYVALYENRLIIDGFLSEYKARIVDEKVKMKKAGMIA